MMLIIAITIYLLAQFECISAVQTLFITVMGFLLFNNAYKYHFQDKH